MSLQHHQGTNTMISDNPQFEMHNFTPPNTALMTLVLHYLELNYDADGKERRNGTSPTMGAFEMRLLLLDL